MKKAIVSLGVLAALLVAAAAFGPLYTSRIVDRQIASVVAGINGQGVFEARYAPGTHRWFSQTDTLTLQPVDRPFKALRQGEVRPIVLHLHIAYGPFPFAAWRRDGVSLTPVGAVVDARVDGLERLMRKAGSQYRLRDVITLTGGNDFTLHVAAGNMQDGQGALLHWSASELVLHQRDGVLHGAGRSGELTISGGSQDAALHVDPVMLVVDHLRMVDGQAIGKLALSWGGLSASNMPNGNRVPQDLQMNGLKMALDTHLAGGIAAGDAVVSLASMKLNRHGDGTSPRLAVQGFEISTSSTDPKDGYTDSQVSWKLDKVDVGGQSYTPARMSLALDHLYVPALVDLMQRLRESEQRLGPQDTAASRQAMQRLLLVMMPPAQALLAHHPVLRLDELNVGTPQGRVTASGRASLEPVGGLTPSIATLSQDLVAEFKLSTPPVLARHVAASILARQGVPPYQLAQASQQYLDSLSAHGMLGMHDGAYTLDLGYRNGSLTLNGHPLGGG